MKIGIVGPADRAVAWESHLQRLGSVSEVIISAKLRGLDNIDACLLLDDSDRRLQHLLQAVKKGYHTFLIAPLPTHTPMVERVYHAAQEANINLQFSHWPTLAPASKWMDKKISKPEFLQIVRDIDYARFHEADHSFDHYWQDELAFCLRWINGSVHHIDLKTVEFDTGNRYLLHLFLRFDSGATSNIFINAAAAHSQHQRLAADNNYLLDCDVLKQVVREGEQSSTSGLYFKKQMFDAGKSAELSVLEFIKSIQLRRPTIYNGYHLLKLSQTIDKINKRLARA